MMLLLKLIIVSFCLNKVILQETSGWKIKIANKDSIKEMAIGRFYEVNVGFSNSKQYPDMPEFPIVNFVLNNINGLIQSSESVYNIDLSKENLLKVMIGTSCNTPIDSEATISFKNIDDLSDFISEEYTVKIIGGIPGNIDIETTSDTLAIGEYGKAYLSHIILNVDPIIMQLSNANSDMDFPEWIIQPHNPLISPNYINGDYALKTSSTVNPDTKITVNIAMKEENKCFTINTKSFDVVINSGIIKSTKRLVVNFRFNLEDFGIVEFMPDNAVIPSMLHCVIITSPREFPTKAKILSPDYAKDNDATTYFFQFFMHKKIRMPTIVLKGLDKYQTYKMKCVYDNTAISTSPLKTTSVFSSINPIQINLSDELLSLCGTWFITTPYNKAAFETKVIEYCNNPILLLSSPRSQKGCLTCYKRDVPDSLFHLDDKTSASSICMASEPTCKTRSDKKALMNYYNALIHDLADSTKVKEKLGLELAIKSPVFSENDSSSTNEHFNIIKLKHDNKTYDISFSHKEGLPQDCNIQLQCDTLPDMNLATFQFILAKGDSKELSFQLPLEDYDDFTYSLKVKCRAMPYFPYHSFQSEFIGMSFIHNTTINCPIFPHLPECNDYPHLDLPSFLTLNPNDEEPEDLILFVFHWDFDEKQNFFISRFPQFEQTTFDIEVLKYTITFGEFVFEWICNLEYYHGCRLVKKMVSKHILKELKEHFPIGSIVEQLSKKDEMKQSTLEERSKMLLITMSYVADNMDAYDETTGRDLLDYVNSYMKESRELIEAVKTDLKKTARDKYIKNVGIDMQRQLAFTMDRMISNIDYAEKEGYYSSDDLHQLLSFNPSLTELKECMKIIASIVVENPEEGEYSLGMNNFNITFKTLTEEERNMNKPIEFKNNNTVITFPLVNWKEKGIKHIAVIYYKKNPMFSYKSVEFYAKEMIQIVLLDEKYNVVTFNEPFLQDSKLIITYTLKAFKDAYAYCYYYKDYKLNVDKVLTDQSNHKYTTCSYDSLDNDIMIGLYDLKGKQKFFIDMWIIVLSIIVICVIITAMTYLIVFVWKKKTNAENLIEAHQIDEINEGLFDDTRNNSISDAEKVARRKQMGDYETPSSIL